MKWFTRMKMAPLLLALALMGVAAGAACSGGDDGAESVSQSTEVQGAPAQTVPPKTIVQVANLQGEAPPAAPPSGWATDASEKIGHRLVATFDSSGDDAWDPVEHPDVFFTSLGPGYSGFLSEENTLPGVVVIDARTREVVTRQVYDLGAESYFEPHAVGVSPDGQFIYLPTGVSAGFGEQNAGRWLILNARTLKLHQVISTPTMPHHAKAFIDAAGNERVLAYTFRGEFAVLDPNDDNRIVGSWDNGTLTARGYLAFVDNSGKYAFVSIRPPTGMEADGGVAVVDLASYRVVANISTHDPSPIWVEFDNAGEFAYVSNGHHSNIAKIAIDGPPPEWELVGLTQAGTAGPYGIRLNWDETQLWASGKGEGSHNRGMTIGLADPVRMPESWGTPGEWYTGCLRNDHGTLNPTDTSELWLSCNSSFEVVVWDMDAKDVKDRIPMPDGGSTHSGSFVRYAPDFSGQVLSDQNGLHGTARDLKTQILAETAAARR